MRPLAAALASTLLVAVAGFASWPQMGADPQHSGTVTIPAQSLRHIYADVVADPFIDREREEDADDVLVHYQAPLVDGSDVFMEVKSGNFTSTSHWETQTWGIRKLSWSANTLAQQWVTSSDWTPIPQQAGGPVFEPVFHAALTNDALYMPAAGGSVIKVNRSSGAVIQRINPFGLSIDPSVYVTGPLTADAQGNIYYNAMRVVPGNAWIEDTLGAWLVRVGTDGHASIATFDSLVPNAPNKNAQCLGQFANSQLPWPPSPTAVPPAAACGSERPGINIAPAIAPDGTVYTISRAHFNTRYVYLVAANADLTPKWSASLRDRLNDGCGVLLPIGGPGGCRAGATTGVDPSDNTPGAGRGNDNSSASPFVAPDGSVFYGAFTRYNWEQGHLMKFTSAGVYVGSYSFGWDVTPSVWAHDGTYSILTKDNHYEGIGSYCDDSTVCPPTRPVTNPAGYFITRLNASLGVEWTYRATNTETCAPRSDGTLDCVSDHPIGFEWCVNNPAVDSNGTTYANSEDGFLYAINNDGTVRQNIFLRLVTGAAYTPVSIGPDGKIYAQNAGHMFVIGNEPKRRAVAH